MVPVAQANAESASAGPGCPMQVRIFAPDAGFDDPGDLPSQAVHLFAALGRDDFARAMQGMEPGDARDVSERFTGSDSRWRLLRPLDIPDDPDAFVIFPTQVQYLIRMPQGNPIESDLPYELTSRGVLEPTDLEDLFLLGTMTYFADAARFTECTSGRSYPIATGGDYLALERAFLANRHSFGAAPLVHVEGGLVTRAAMEGPDRRHLVVDRFIKTLPGETCARHVSTASLTDTYWRINSLMGAPVEPVDGRREPHLVLLGESEARFRATVGCNQLIGGYQRNSDGLTFGAVASTRMACPPPLDVAERSLRTVLEATRAVRQAGPMLVFEDDDGQPVAEFSAVYLR